MILLRSMPGLRKTSPASSEYRGRVPLDVAARLKGRKVRIEFPASGMVPAASPTITLGSHAKVGLRTDDKRVAVERTAIAIARLEQVYNAARRGPETLTHRQAVAVSRFAYDHVISLAGDTPGSEERWVRFLAWSRALREGRIDYTHRVFPDDLPDDAGPAEQADAFSGHFGIPDDDALEGRFGAMAHWALQHAGYSEDAGPRRMILEEIDRALTDAAEHILRNSRGDYRPDAKQDRFPTLAASMAPAPGSVTLNDLLDGWWKEAKATGRSEVTWQNYRGVVANVAAFLKHDDARRVTAEDVVRYKAHRLASVNPRTGQTLSAKTVKDTDLVALKSLYGWAVSNKLLPINPAKEVTLKLGKRRKVRDKSLTDEEAQAYLAAASAVPVTSGRGAKLASAKRWVPWLLAYTGCRLGEATQLRREDVEQVGDLWTVRITPEAGTVKTGEFRTVVLHEHLVEMGFPAFAAASEAGHLFLTPSRNGGVLGPLRSVMNKVTEFARGSVPDPNVAPNHGWRHRHKRICRNVGIDRVVAHAITGHSNEHEGDDYGEVTLEAQARELAKFPRQG